MKNKTARYPHSPLSGWGNMVEEESESVQDPGEDVKSC